MPSGRHSALLALLLVGGCGGALPRDEPAALDVRGAVVTLDTQAPFARAPDFPARLESTIDAALAYWGGAWSILEGTSIELTDTPRVPCGGAASALGCQEARSIRLTVQDPSIGPFACVEQTVLVHEIGHAVVGDPNHLDPRWMELEPLERALAGRPGYTQEGVVPCVLYLSVWRHILGMP